MLRRTICLVNGLITDYLKFLFKTTSKSEREQLKKNFHVKNKPCNWFPLIVYVCYCCCLILKNMHYCKLISVISSCALFQLEKYYPPVHVRDPRSRLSTLWAKTEAADLILPRFKVWFYCLNESIRKIE